MLRWLFGRKQEAIGAGGEEQAVLVHVPAEGGPDQALLDRVYALEDRLARAVRKVGEFDGNEWGEEGGVLYLYGPDADRLWAAVEPHVRGAGLPRGSSAVKRYGEPGSREERVEIG